MNEKWTQMDKSEVKNAMFGQSMVIVLTVACLSNYALAGGALSGGATEWTQIANNIELAESVRTQIQTYREIARTLDVAKQNIQSINRSFLGNPASALLRLRRAVKRDGELGRAAVYTLENIDRQFPGYAHYLQQQDPAQTIDTYIAWDARSRNNVRAALEAVGVNSEELIAEGQVIRQLQRQSQSAVGQKQALQVGNEIALAQIAQNQRLQVLLQRQIELQANYQLQQQDKEEKGRAVANKLNDYTKPKPSTGADWIKQAPSPFPGK